MTTADDAPKAVLEAIADAMKVNISVLSNAKAVEVVPQRRDASGWPTYIIAARLVGFEFSGSEIGTWATGAEPAEPIVALSTAARDHTRSSEAARLAVDTDEVAARLSGYPEATEAADAVHG
jgi:hypothetical protein